MKLFIPEDKLSDICVDEMSKEVEDQSDWYKIISNLHEIDVSTKNGYSWQEDEDSPLFILSLDLNITINDATDYISNIPNSPESVLENPCSLFLLNIDEDKAKGIEDNYGVICRSVTSLGDTDKELVKGIISFELDQNENEYGWGRVLKDLSKLPSNSMLIIDRYLFKNDRGLDNAIEIMDALLPMHLKCDYHIAILTDKDQFAKGSSFSSISTKLHKRLPKREYRVVVEVISINSCISDYYKITHNRRILTNYGRFEAPYKLDAFKGDVSTEAQSLTSKRMFTENGLNGEGDNPFKGQNRDFEIIAKFIQYWKEHNQKVDEEMKWKNGTHTIDYSLNGDCRKTDLDLVNRLFL